MPLCWRQPTSCLAAAATHVVVSCGQFSTNQTNWVASDVTVMIDTEVKLVFQCYWMARWPPVADKLWAIGGRHAAVYSRPFRRHQNTILERFCIVSNGRHVGLRAWTALVDSLQSPKQKLPTTLELQENCGRRRSRQHNTSALTLPGSCRCDVR